MTGLRILSIVAALGVITRTVAAQQPSASAAAFGMAGNYVAAAEGFDAVAWNPAMLGMAGAPAFSLNLLSAGVVSGLNPVKLKDITTFGGQVIPPATKEAWLQAIGSGKESGAAHGGVSLIAVSFGLIGMQLGASGTGVADLSQDAVEAILFGNTGRTGTPKNLSLEGSKAGGSGFVTTAVSFALPTSWQPTGRSGEQFSFGVTGKYIVGVGVVRAQDDGSLITPDNISVAFPAVYSTRSENGGSGMGVDVGLAWNDGRTTLGATARNIVNTFAWNTTRLRATPGLVKFDGSTNSVKFDEVPYSAAPVAMRAALEAESFKPEIAVGFARRTSRLTVTADASQRLGDGIEINPKTHIGAGVELRGISVLLLRAGVAAVSQGLQLAGGIGVRVGSLEIGGALSVRSKSGGSEQGAMFSLVSIR